MDEQDTTVLYQRVDELEKRQNHFEKQQGEMAVDIKEIKTTQAIIIEMRNDLRQIKSIFIAWDSLRGFDRVVKWFFTRVIGFAAFLSAVAAIVYCIKNWPMPPK